MNCQKHCDDVGKHTIAECEHEQVHRSKHARDVTLTRRFPSNIRRGWPWAEGRDCRLDTWRCANLGQSLDTWCWSRRRLKKHGTRTGTIHCNSYTLNTFNVRESTVHVLLAVKKYSKHLNLISSDHNTICDKVMEFFTKSKQKSWVFWRKHFFRSSSHQSR